ncbi:MAG TPA: hypothetical protein VJX67_12575 [Blastocatellia bacterium]|nr:hypothetical protein [Blastocatellia bacterium]
MVRGRIAFKLIEYARSLNDDQKIQLSTALVKRFNQRGVALKGETIDHVESRTINEYLNCGRLGESMMLPYGSSMEKQINERIASDSAKRGDKSRIRPVVLRSLEKTLGAPETKPAGIVKYTTSAQGWRLRTTIDFGHNYGQISYAHTSIPPKPPPLSPPHSHLRLAGASRADDVGVIYNRR